MNTTLTIGGTSYTAAQRAAAQIEIDSWGWDLESDLSAEFHETRPGSMQPRFHCGQIVTITIDAPTAGTKVFTGEIATVIPQFTQHGWVFAYRCMGPKYQASGVYCTNVDGTGVVIYNLPPDDPEYLPANAGLSVGTIIGDLLALSAVSAALTALGITTDATTTSQLSALTVVPNEPVYLTGRVMSACESLLQRWARNVHCYVDPNGKIRFYDTTAGTATSLTLGVDPVDPPCFTRDIRGCASRVQVRGKGKIYPGYVSLGKNTLTKAWTSAQQTAWKYTDFSQPNDAYDSGTVVSVNSPTQVTVQSSSSSESWAVNFWNTRQAWIYLTNSLGTDLTYQESRPVTANAALTAGGNAAITLGFPLENAGSSAYTNYQLIGKVDDLGGSSANNRNGVFRLYNVTDPGSRIANHMVAKFPAQVPFMNYSGTAESLTWYPEAAIVKGLVTWPATFKVMPQTGQILFDEPVVKALNSLATLNTGGAGVAVPDDIYVLLAYSRGALTSTYPADVGGVAQYGGTSYTADSLQFTQTIDVESWVYQGNQSLMDAYAQMMWQSMCDTVVTGSVNYRGAWTAAMAGPNLKLNITGSGFTTGMETLGVPIKSFTLRYHPDGQGGMLYSSQAGVSSRRNPRTGDTLYMHLTQWSQVGFKLSAFGDAAANLMGAGSQYQAGAAGALGAWGSSGSATDLAAGAVMGQGAMAGGAAAQMGSLASGAIGSQAALSGQGDSSSADDASSAAMAGIVGDTDNQNIRRKQPRRKYLSRDEAREQWQEKAAPRAGPNQKYRIGSVLAEAAQNATLPEQTISEKPHSLSGVTPPPDQADKTAENRAARKQQQASAARRVQAERQPKLSRAEAVDESTNKRGQAMKERRAQKFRAMEARVRRRDKADDANGHSEIRNRRDGDEETEA